FADEVYEVCDRTRCVAWVALDRESLIKLDGPPELTLPHGLRRVPTLREAGEVRPRIALVQGTAAIAALNEELRPRWEDRVHFNQSFSSTGRANLALTAVGADKGVALRVACEDLGVDPDDVVAFGDAEND